MKLSNCEQNVLWSESANLSINSFNQLLESLGISVERISIALWRVIRFVVFILILFIFLLDKIHLMWYNFYMFIIYQITNNVNNKCYIGLTKQTLLRRWAGHKSESNHKDHLIARAIRKYGVEAFDIKQIDFAETLQEACDKEVFWIQKHNSFGEGYNSTSGGELQKDITNEVRIKISTFHKGKSQTPKQKAALLVANIGRPCPEAVRKALIKSNKNRVWSDISKQKIAKFMKGRKHNQEERAKISAGVKGKPWSLSRWISNKRNLIDLSPYLAAFTILAEECLNL